MWIIINKRHFVDITAHTKLESHEKADSEASTNWQEVEVKGKPDKKCIRGARS